MRRSLLPVAVFCATGLAAPEALAAAPNEDGPFPWSRRTVLLGFGFAPSFGTEIHSLGFGVGARYFVWDGLSVGLRVSDTVYIYRSSFKQEFPGIEKTSPTNEVMLMPTLQYVFVRRYRFSPYVLAGVGPVFYNHQRGTVGEWLVGPGAYIGLWGPIFLEIGIDFMADFPEQKWKDAFWYDPPIGNDDAGSYRGCTLISRPCSFNISPHVGFVFALGTRSKRSRKGPPPPAPVNPMPETEPEPTPPIEPEPEPEPDPDAPPPDDLAPPDPDAPAPDPPPPTDEEPIPEDAPPPPEVLWP